MKNILINNEYCSGVTYAVDYALENDLTLN